MLLQKNIVLLCYYLAGGSYMANIVPVFVNKLLVINLGRQLSCAVTEITSFITFGYFDL
jgi:hypothetical protein